MYTRIYLFSIFFLSFFLPWNMNLYYALVIAINEIFPFSPFFSIHFSKIYAAILLKIRFNVVNSWQSLLEIISSRKGLSWRRGSVDYERGKSRTLVTKWLIGGKKKKRRRRRIYVVRRRRLGSIRLNLWPGKLVLLNLAERAYTEWRVVKATFICSNCLCNYVAGEGAFNRYTSSRPLQIRPVIRRAFVNRPFVKADVAFLLNFYFFFFFFFISHKKELWRFSIDSRAVEPIYC